MRGTGLANHPQRYSRRQFLELGLGMVAAGLVAGCAQPAGAPAPTAPAAGSAPAPTAAGAAQSAAQGNLVFQAFPAGSEHLPQILETFTQQYAEKVELSVVAQNYHPTIETRLRAGVDIDVIALDDPYQAKWYKAGWLTDLEGLPGLDKLQQDMLPNIWEAGKVDGKLLALPGNGLTKVMVYNAEVLDRAGLKPAQSWDEFFDQCVKMKQEGHADFPYVPMWTKAFGLTVYFAIGDSYSRGAKEWFDPKTFEPRYDNDPAVLETLEFWKRLWDAKLVPPDVLTVDHNATTAIFGAGGRAYFQHNHSQSMFPLNTQPDKFKVAGKIRLMLYPGTTRECLTGTNWVCMTTRFPKDRTWKLERFLGGTDKNGDYFAPRKWRALLMGGEVAYKPVLNDPEVQAAWSKFTDLKILAEQKERARFIGNVVQAPWFSEWIERATAEFQNAIIGATTPKEALKTTAAFARSKNKA